jgi:hypothetical protein
VSAFEKQTLVIAAIDLLLIVLGAAGLVVATRRGWW